MGKDILEEKRIQPVLDTGLVDTALMQRLADQTVERGIVQTVICSKTG